MVFCHLSYTHRVYLYKKGRPSCTKITSITTDEIIPNPNRKSYKVIWRQKWLPSYRQKFNYLHLQAGGEGRANIRTRICSSDDKLLAIMLWFSSWLRTPPANPHVHLCSFLSPYRVSVFRICRYGSTPFYCCVRGICSDTYRMEVRLHSYR